MREEPGHSKAAFAIVNVGRFAYPQVPAVAVDLFHGPQGQGRTVYGDCGVAVSPQSVRTPGLRCRIRFVALAENSKCQATAPRIGDGGFHR